MLSNLLHAKLCLLVFGASFAASNWQFLAYVAALLAACFVLNIRGECVRLKFARLQIRIRHVAEFFLLIRGLFLLFYISLDRAALWSCSRKCLRSAAWLLCTSRDDFLKFFRKS